MLIDSKKFTFGFEDLKIELFTLKNKSGFTTQITNYGGRIVNLFTPDKKGNLEDIVLGYDTIKEYIENPDHFFGAIIGRYANRIANSKISIHGKKFLLDKNEGEQVLHSGNKGFHRIVWNAKQTSESTLELTHFSKHLDQGFPGNLEVKVVYNLTDENELEIDYTAVSDATTFINLTNHSYFNLSGDLKKTITEHSFQINADHFLPVNDKMIPLGNFEEVANTPFDFRTQKTIKENFHKYHKQLELGCGFDHNFVLNNAAFGFAAKVIDETTKRTLEVFTTAPGIQFYSGNHLDNISGKNDNIYKKRSAFCLETQHFPNSPNQSNFPSTLVSPNEEFSSTTIYKFGILKES
ncbi:aldose epimerase family protein [uncultured Polaribacter sp.]|uniref:aldose epimerase family protein n=1 Tax=uncultured Polaribacter sp. TaxID=174711 RepID=UPI0026255160|nr:aldose epimerase family protein [uncultured Polaribacter sp.]